MVELDKSQKKIARTLISRALERECCTFLAKLKRLLQDEKAQSCHEKYLEIYKSIQTFDKDISRQYDGLNGSRYALTVFSLFYNGILTEKDLSEFDDRTREAFLEHRRQWNRVVSRQHGHIPHMNPACRTRRSLAEKFFREWNAVHRGNRPKKIASQSCFCEKISIFGSC